MIGSLFSIQRSSACWMSAWCTRLCTRGWFGFVFSSFSALKSSIDSVVCCVRFSSDGKYLATGCNRTAQIYDTKTGTKTWFV